MAYEREFLTGAGMAAGSLRHVRKEDMDSLFVELLSEEALRTSLIEGEMLDRASLQSSLRKAFGLQYEERKASAAEFGISEMMVDLYKTFHEPLTHERLFAWHGMVTHGRRDLQVMGGYRRHEDPLQMVSGPMGRRTVHFEAPPSSSVPVEMDRFVQWFNVSLEDLGKRFPLLRAGIAHLYFESIHPFEDGNGRIGRALSEKALSQGIGRPTLIALSHTIESSKKDYYEALHRNSQGLDIGPWLHYFSQTILQAQAYTQQLIDHLIDKTRFFQTYGHLFNDRQLKVMQRMFREGVAGFKGGLSADNYVAITGTSAATATRDLQKLVEMGALHRTGTLKGTRYHLRLSGKEDLRLDKRGLSPSIPAMGKRSQHLRKA